jgi:cell shape-determining protein MreD
MINRILFVFFIIIVIFVDTFFVKNIISWLNLSFLVVLYLFFKKSYSGIKDFGFIFFIFKDFFNLNPVGVSLLIFVTVIYLTGYLEKIAGEYYVSIINILAIIIINTFFYENIFSLNTFLSLSLLVLTVFISFISNRGSFRFNKT